MSILPKSSQISGCHGAGCFDAILRFWNYRELIYRLTVREITQRHLGTVLGALWSLITPLLMLAIYTCVFSVILKAGWADPSHPIEGTSAFAMVLFSGLIPFNMFAETATRSTTLILSVPSYVKKVVFPLEILPIVTVAGALVYSFINLGILVIAIIIFLGYTSSTVYLLPLAYIPLILLCLGLTWFLSSLGVYARDIRQGIEIVVQLLFFLSPIVYPLSSVPESIRLPIQLNPLTPILDGFRRTLLWQEPLDWSSWAVWTGLSFLVALSGYIWFMKTKDGFANIM
jgi:lipopolysaccharide transport system permease protein